MAVVISDDITDIDDVVELMNWEQVEVCVYGAHVAVDGEEHSSTVVVKALEFRHEVAAGRVR